jgi:hypothetical protein
MELPRSGWGQLATLPNGTTDLAKWKSLKNTENQAFSGATLPLCQARKPLRGCTAARDIWVYPVYQPNNPV